MRLVAQCVGSASVVADVIPTGEIGQWLILLVGFSKENSEKLSLEVVDKIVKLRVFASELL
jgi:D-Tyr-tRNAtyr deacylase